VKLSVTEKDPLIFYSGLNAGHVQTAIATNFCGPFDLFRAVWAGLASDSRQVFREKVKGCEDHPNGAEQKQNHYYLPDSNPHSFTSG
jgi:hypothetical protein